jgi:Tripartite tricarboxylate transporter TctB family
MNPDFVKTKDCWGGLMLIAIGVAAIAIARNYPFGTALRMGPGYVPIVLGAILIAFGVSLLGAALRGGEKIAGGWSLRALVMLPLALILFGLLMEHGGFVPAMLVLVFASAAASAEFKFIDALLLSLGLTALSVVVFVWLLGLPYPLIAGLN